MDFPTPFPWGIEAPSFVYAVSSCLLPLVVARTVQPSRWTSKKYATVGGLPAFVLLHCHRASAPALKRAQK